MLYLAFQCTWIKTHLNLIAIQKISCICYLFDFLPKDWSVGPETTCQDETYKMNYENLELFFFRTNFCQCQGKTMSRVREKIFRGEGRGKIVSLYFLFGI